MSSVSSSNKSVYVQPRVVSAKVLLAKTGGTLDGLKKALSVGEASTTTSTKGQWYPIVCEYDGVKGPIFISGNFTLTKTAADPNNKSDKRNDYPEGKSNLKIDTNLDNSAELGIIFTAINDVYLNFIEDCKKTDKIVMGKPWSRVNREIKQLIQHSYYDTKKQSDVITNSIRINFDLNSIVEKHPLSVLKNKPVTQVFDIKKPVKDEKGNIKTDTTGYPLFHQYELDGKNIDNSNCYKVFTTGTKIKNALISVASIAITEKYATISAVVHNMIVDHKESTLQVDCAPEELNELMQEAYQNDPNFSKTVDDLVKESENMSVSTTPAAPILD